MQALLKPEEPKPFGVENRDGGSDFLFVSDHAGHAIPAGLGDLGIGEADRTRHIAWDIGIYGVTTRLARALDATYLFQPYSRLVIDCNRRAGTPRSIPAMSDGTRIPANEALGREAIRMREEAILQPYHAAIAATIAERRAGGRATILVAMHSCTPALLSDPMARPWHIGVLANRDWRVGDQLIETLAKQTDLCVGRNQPYSVDDENDYTIPLHGEAGGLPHVEIEIRQDLITDDDGQKAWARRMEEALPAAIAAAELDS